MATTHRLVASSVSRTLALYAGRANTHIQEHTARSIGCWRYSSSRRRNSSVHYSWYHHLRFVKVSPALGAWALMRTLPIGGLLGRGLRRYGEEDGEKARLRHDVCDSGTVMGYGLLCQNWNLLSRAKSG